METAAWIGRFVCWLLLAIGWRQMATALTDRRSIVILSGGLFVVLNRYGHMAGEWVVGGVESKCVAYAFLFIAIGSWLRQKTLSSWLNLGLAGLFHGLVGFWGALAIGLSSLFGKDREFWRGRGREAWLGILLYSVLMLVGLWPSLMMNQGVDRELVDRAHRVQSFYRLAHHQWLLHFRPERFLAAGILLSVWFLASSEARPSPRHRALNRLAWVAVLIAGVGGIWSWLATHEATSGLSASMLRLYWFRLADALVPLATTFSLFPLLANRLRCPPAMSIGLAVLVIGVAMGHHVWRQLDDPRPGACRQSLPNYPGNPSRTIETWRNWKRACHWIRQETPADARFLTPYKQQTFKWYAERAEFFCWKDAPQDAAGLDEWVRRLNWIRPYMETDYGLLYLTDEQLAELAERYGIRYAVVPQSAWDLRQAIGDPVSFPLVYPDRPQVRSTYVVLELSAQVD